MRTYLDCYPCFLRQALEAARVDGADETVQRAVLNQVMRILEEVDLDATPQTGFTFPVLLDPGAARLAELGIRNFPTSILVGRDGTVRKMHTGMLTAGMLETEIAPLLSR